MDDRGAVLRVRRTLGHRGIYFYIVSCTISYPKLNLPGTERHEDELLRCNHGCPNATGISQWADMYNNGHLKVKMVLAKRYLLQQKASDFAKDAKGKDHWRIPAGLLKLNILVNIFIFLK